MITIDPAIVRSASLLAADDRMVVVTPCHVGRGDVQGKRASLVAGATLDISPTQVALVSYRDQ
jgi:hypothetical protein